MPDEPQAADRHIDIHRDAVGSAILSGDGSKVFIYHYHLEQPQVSEPTPAQLAPNPYRGLAAFQVEDADVYFGRETQITRLWNRLRDLQECATQEHPPIRLLPILGPSGSGKSSLARAGLLPELARHPLPGCQQPRVVVLRPGETPLEKLAVVLARIATNDPSPVAKSKEFERVLRQKNNQEKYNGLRRIVTALSRSNAASLLILVDQFEEVYSLCKDIEEQSAFIDNLLDAAAVRSGQVSVIITFRSDFLSETQRHPLLNQIIGSDQCVIVPAMTSEELRQAIEEPAKRARHALDSAIIDLLIQQTERREGALPLLQFALMRVWEGLKEDKQPTETLKTIGGVGGALAKEAQRIYYSLNQKEKDIARRIFVGLVQLGEGTKDTRRRATVASLISSQDNPKQVRQVLDRFSDFRARLITLSSANGAEIAEVTHEALLENWQQLSFWLDGKCDLIRQQRKIEAAAEEWDTQKRKRGYLLQGRQLADANRFRKQQAKQFPLSEKAENFVRKSLWQQNLNQLPSLGLALVILVLGLDFLIREARVDAQNKYLHYASPFIGKEGFSRKKQVVLALTQGCSKVKEKPYIWMHSYFQERILGSCRSLTGGSLYRVDLSHANLQGAALSRTEFTGADLSSANLSSADLYGANLRNANLSNANLSSANLTGVDLDSADLSGANLSNTRLGSTLSNQFTFSYPILIYPGSFDLSSPKNWTDKQLGAAKLCRTALPQGSKLAPNRDCKELGIPEN